MSYLEIVGSRVHFVASFLCIWTFISMFAAILGGKKREAAITFYVFLVMSAIWLFLPGGAE